MSGAVIDQWAFEKNGANEGKPRNKKVILSDPSRQVDSQVMFVIFKIKQTSTLSTLAQKNIV